MKFIPLTIGLLVSLNVFGAEKFECRYSLDSITRPNSSHMDLGGFNVKLRPEGRGKIHVLRPNMPFSKTVQDKAGKPYEIRDIGGNFKDNIIGNVKLALLTASPDTSEIQFVFSPTRKELIRQNGKEALNLQNRIYSGYKAYFGNWELIDDMAPYMKEGRGGIYVPDFISMSDAKLYYSMNILVVNDRSSSGETSHLATLSLFRPTALERLFPELMSETGMSWGKKYSMYERMPKKEQRRLESDINQLVKGEAYGEFSRFMKFDQDLPQEIMAALAYEGLQLARSGPIPLRYVFAAAGHPKLEEMYREKFKFKLLGHYKDYSGILDSLWYLDLKSEEAQKLIESLKL